MFVDGERRGRMNKRRGKREERGDRGGGKRKGEER